MAAYGIPQFVMHWRCWLQVRLAVGLLVIVVAGCADRTASSDPEGGLDSPDYTHVVFATQGDPETSIDLFTDGPGQFRLANMPQSMTLDGSMIKISHTATVHELAIVVEEQSGKLTHVWATTQPEEGPAYPLEVSGDQRWVIDAKGIPFLANGDASWSLFAQLDRNDATMYYADRAEKGVNLLLGRMIEQRFSDNDPVTANRYDELPFLSRLSGKWTSLRPSRLESLASRVGIGRNRLLEDFTTPNEAYWQHVDWLIREAYRHGMAIIAFPAYIGYLNGDQGWTVALVANGADRMSVYGEFIGRRYRDYPNIIWGFGGDAALSKEASAHDAMARAVSRIDDVHLATAKSARNRSSLDDYDEPWLDINAVYSSHDRVAQEMARGWAQRPILPVFLIEGQYGNEHGMTPRDLRRQMWQAICSGGFGHVYGNAPTWYFGTTASASANDFADIGGLNWMLELDSFGADSLRYVSKLLKVRDVSTMMPGHVRNFILSDGACGTANDQGFIAYVDTVVEAVLVERSRFLPGSYDVRWLNPADGSIVDGGTVMLGGSGAVELAPPGPEDWVLMVDHRLPELRSQLRSRRYKGRTSVKLWFAINGYCGTRH